MTKLEFANMFSKLENLNNKQKYEDCKFTFMRMRDNVDDDEVALIYDKSFFVNDYDDENGTYEQVLDYIEDARLGNNMYILAEYLTSRKIEQYKLTMELEFNELERCLIAQHEEWKKRKVVKNGDN